MGSGARCLQWTQALGTSQHHPCLAARAGPGRHLAGVDVGGGTLRQSRSPESGGERGRRDGAGAHCSEAGRQLFAQAAVGGSRGEGDRCGSPSPGGRGKAGSGVCSQAGSHPRLPAKSPGEAGGAGLQEEAAGDSAISRGLWGSGSWAEGMSYGALSPGETEVA